MTVLRSLLFAPGNHPKRVAKAFQVGADAVIIDLEDAVPMGAKVGTRTAVAEFLLAAVGTRPRRFVRINGMRTIFAIGDLEAVTTAELDAVVLPKTESAADVVTCDRVLSHLERDRQLAVGRIEIQPIIETAEGLLRAEEIARASGRVKCLSFGAGDFSLDCQVPWEKGNPLLLHARIQLVVVSRAAGLEPPLDTVFALLDDEEGLLAETGEARRIGYQGKLTIHPKQVEIVNRVFTPTPAELEFARRVCSEFDRAQEAGSAAIVVDGVFVDYPVVYRAQRLIETAKEIGLA